MNEIISKLLACVTPSLLAFAFWLAAVVTVTIVIARHPELSDDKVKWITCMFRIWGKD